jgi:hypothetical protein
VATLPVSAGPVYVFLALDHDATSISASAVVSLALNAATAVFVTVYVLMAQRRSLWISGVSGIYGLARNHFGARSCPLDCPLGVRSRPGCLRPRWIVRLFCLAPMPPTIRPWYDFLVRAGMVTLHEYYGDLASPRRRSGYGRSASERRSRPCWFWRSAANAASDSGATWIGPGPDCGPRCLRCLECRLVCYTAS